MFREKVHLNSLTENTNSGMLWTEEQQFLHLLGVPRKRLRIGKRADTLISPDLDHASVGKRNLAEQAQQKSCAFFMQRMPTFSSNVSGLRKRREAP